MSRRRAKRKKSKREKRRREFRERFGTKDELVWFVCCDSFLHSFLAATHIVRSEQIPQLSTVSRLLPSLEPLRNRRVLSVERQHSPRHLESAGVRAAVHLGATELADAPAVLFTPEDVDAFQREALVEDPVDAAAAAAVAGERGREEERKRGRERVRRRRREGQGKETS